MMDCFVVTFDFLFMSHAKIPAAHLTENRYSSAEFDYDSATVAFVERNRPPCLALPRPAAPFSFSFSSSQ